MAHCLRRLGFGFIVCFVHGRLENLFFRPLFSLFASVKFHRSLRNLFEVRQDERLVPECLFGTIETEDRIGPLALGRNPVRLQPGWGGRPDIQIDASVSFSFAGFGCD